MWGRSFAVMLFSAVSSIASGQSVDSPEVETIVEKLMPIRQDGTIEGARDIRGLIEEEGQGDSLASIDFHIEFDYNSAVLKLDAILTLRRLGHALADPRLAGYRFRIGGHTDSRGSEAYNQDLSEQRAASVYQFLVGSFGLAAERFEIVGFGETKLLNLAQPESAENRRVRVENIGSLDDHRS